MINIIYICVFMLILKYVYMLKNLNIYLRLDLGNIYILFIIYQFQKILIHFSQVKSVYIYIYIYRRTYIDIYMESAVNYWINFH